MVQQASPDGRISAAPLHVCARACAGERGSGRGRERLRACRALAGMRARGARAIARALAVDAEVGVHELDNRAAAVEALARTHTHTHTRVRAPSP